MREPGGEAASPLIETATELAETCRRLSEAGTFALDTEFVKERTFFAQLGIVQVATKGFAAIIDPRAIESLDPLRDLWADPAVEKVVHSGFQDCEVLFQRMGVAPRKIFDTQIGAALLGYGEQISYAKLAALVTGVKLQKLETRTDWVRRPLTRKQIDYALDDVRYLPRIREHLGERLAGRNRDQWAVEEFRFLERVDTYAAPTPDEAHRRLRVGSLSPRQRGALRELAAWREAEARRRDLPRGWILTDGALVEIARRLPRAEAALRRVRSIEPRELERSSREILAAVARGVEKPATEPNPISPEDELPETEPLARLLEAWLRARAQSSDVATALLGTREDVKSLAAGYLKGKLPDLPLLAGWRREVVGQELVDILEGKLRLAVDPKAGRITAERA